MRIGIKPTFITSSEPGNRAANAHRPTVEDMGINHSRLYVLMAQDFLHRPNVVTAESLSKYL